MLITQDAADAEEAAQDAFVKAWRALPRFRAGEPWRPWLLTIVANEARNRRRSAGRRTALALRASPPRDDVSAEATVLAAESRTALLGALAGLRDDDRLVLGCRYLLELSEAETAAALGVKPGTVKSRTSRALDRLRGQVRLRPRTGPARTGRGLARHAGPRRRRQHPRWSRAAKLKVPGTFRLRLAASSRRVIWSAAAGGRARRAVHRVPLVRHRERGDQARRAERDAGRVAGPRDPDDHRAAPGAASCRPASSGRRGCT